jgi:hypothetical protein
MLTLGERERQARKLEKKLREIEALRKAAEAPGAPPLNEEQLAKASGEADLRARLATLQGGEAAPGGEA